MDTLLETIAIAVCGLCNRPLDVTQPHAIVKHDFAHLDCADAFDAREWGREFKGEKL